MALLLKRKRRPSLIHNPGYAVINGQIHAPPDWMLGTRIDYEGECPAFWADKGNNRAMYDVGLVYVMMAVRYRELMPVEVMEVIDYYLDYHPLPATPKDSPSIRGMIEEWAGKVPTQRERMIAEGVYDV